MAEEKEVKVKILEMVDCTTAPNQYGNKTWLLTLEATKDGKAVKFKAKFFGKKELAIGEEHTVLLEKKKPEDRGAYDYNMSFPKKGFGGGFGLPPEQQVRVAAANAAATLCGLLDEPKDYALFLSVAKKIEKFITTGQ